MNEFRVVFITKDNEKCYGGWCQLENFTLEKMEQFKLEADTYFTNGWYLEYR